MSSNRLGRPHGYIRRLKWLIYRFREKGEAMSLQCVNESYVRRQRSGKAMLFLAAVILMLGGWLLHSGVAATTVQREAVIGSVRPAAVDAGGQIDSVSCAVRKPGSANEVAIIDFKGPIGENFDPGTVYGLINGITTNGKIGAIALRVDSTGGNSYVAKKLYETLRKAKLGCGLPMAAFIGNVGTSGGYWIALAADEIHADTLSTVGGVGVVAIYTNELEKDAQAGIHHQVIRTGERKWPMIPYLPVKSDDVIKIRESLEIVLEEFVEAVETSRRGKLRLSRAELATGEAWMGRDARRLGLVEPAAEINEVMSRLLGRPAEAYRQVDLSKAMAARPEDEEPAGSAKGARTTQRKES